MFLLLDFFAGFFMEQFRFSPAAFPFLICLPVEKNLAAYLTGTRQFYIDYRYLDAIIRSS
jgi:hypothetical protein